VQSDDSAIASFGLVEKVASASSLHDPVSLAKANSTLLGTYRTPIRRVTASCIDNYEGGAFEVGDFVKIVDPNSGGTVGMNPIWAPDYGSILIIERDIADNGTVKFTFSDEFRDPVAQYIQHLSELGFKNLITTPIILGGDNDGSGIFCRGVQDRPNYFSWVSIAGWWGDEWEKSAQIKMGACTMRNLRIYTTDSAGMYVVLRVNGQDTPLKIHIPAFSQPWPASEMRVFENTNDVVVTNDGDMVCFKLDSDDGWSGCGFDHFTVEID
jgi:hypothetical protein